MEKLKVDIDSIVKQLQKSVGKKGVTQSALIGEYRSAFKGKGIEFAGFRQYTPADDASRIDWKASARAQELLIREYVVERNLDIFFLIDASSSMLYGSIDKLKIEHAIEVVAALSYMFLDNGSNVGMALFTDKLVKVLAQGTGINHFAAVKHFLIDPKAYEGKYNLSAALKYITGLVQQDSTLIIISDFIGLDPNWKRLLQISTLKYDVIGIMIRDKLDKELPRAGRVLVSDPLSDDYLIINTNKIRNKYLEHVTKWENEIKSTFLASNSDFLILYTHEDIVEQLRLFFKRRRGILK